MTIHELESENQFLEERNRNLSEELMELKAENMLLKSENQSELEPRFYFNHIVEDYQGDDDVDRLVELVDYLNAYINNHSDGIERNIGNGSFDIFGI